MRGAKLVLAAALAAGMIFPATGQATVTIGSNLTRAPTGTFAARTLINSSLPPSYQASGGLTSPVNGTVTGWRIWAGNGGTTAFQVVKPLGGDLFTGAGTTITVVVPGSAITTIALPLPISIGDSIGVRSDNFGGLQMWRGDPLPQYKEFYPPLQDGEPGRAPVDTLAGELTINADITPTSTFTLGTTTRDKKKGTATITANVPNPGELTASGKGAKTSTVARTSRAASAPGPVKLLIRAKGKSKATLNSTGKLKLRLEITFTPIGGTAFTLPTKLKLKKKLG